MENNTKTFAFLFTRSSVESLRVTVQGPADADDEGELGGIVTDLVIESCGQDEWFLKHCDVSLDRQAIIDSQDGQPADFTLVRNAAGELDEGDELAAVEENDVADILRRQALSCYEALQGYWDYSQHPEEFESMLEGCERALRLMGEAMPDYTARDAEEQAKNEE